MSERLIKSGLQGRIKSAEQAAASIKNGMTIAMGGYAMAGYPKAVVEELVKRKQGGENLVINLITGANVPWIDEQLGAANIINRRTPMIASRTLASQANGGSIKYIEQQMCKMPRLLRSGSFGKIDIAVVEAIGFNQAGDLIPSTSVGMVHYLMDNADAIIVEVNSAYPKCLEGIHDIYLPKAPPKTEPIPLLETSQRIGHTAIPVDEAKIIGIVETNRAEDLGPQAKGSEQAEKIAGHLFEFLEKEFEDWGGKLPPIQTGFGGIANAITDEFSKSSFTDLQFFCGGVTEPVLELLAEGKVRAISTGGIGMSPRVEEILTSMPDLKAHLIIRNGDITNNAEIIGRLGLIALTTGIEMDIYGNINSSHIAGSRVVNGIGGGANFAQNAGISIVVMPALSKGGAISNIVPMVSHQDICEHDVDIVVTENGFADLRGLEEGERADIIIKECASNLYQKQLNKYLTDARERCGGHHPQLPVEAFEWYTRLKTNKTMLEDKL